MASLQASATWCTNAAESGAHALKLNQLVVESRLAAADIQNLKDRGHEVRLGEPWSEGRLCVSTRERDSQGRLILRTAASARGMQAFAVGR